MHTWRWPPWSRGTGDGQGCREIPGTRQGSVVTIGRGLARKKLLEGAIHNFFLGGTFEVGLSLNHDDIGLLDMVTVQLGLPRGVLRPVVESFPCAPPFDEFCEIVPCGAEFLKQRFVTG